MKGGGFGRLTLEKSKIGRIAFDLFGATAETGFLTPRLLCMKLR